MSSSNNPSSATFETSFDNDVAFKSLIESSSNNNENNTNDHQSLNDITGFSSDRKEDGDQDQQQKQNSEPEDLNLFISDLLEQMVSFLFVVGNLNPVFFDFEYRTGK